MYLPDEVVRICRRVIADPKGEAIRLLIGLSFILLSLPVIHLFLKGVFALSDSLLVDVYQWLEATGIKTDGAEKLEFCKPLDALVLTFVGGRAVEVDAPEFWTWVIDKQLPHGLAGFETVFGVPQVRGDDGYCPQVTFAASNDGDPRSWAPPPACLTEWEQVEDATA